MTFHNDKGINPTGYNPCNISVSNILASKYIKQILMDIKGEIINNKVTLGALSTPLTSMDISHPDRKSTREQWP